MLFSTGNVFYLFFICLYYFNHLFFHIFLLLLRSEFEVDFVLFIFFRPFIWLVVDIYFTFFLCFVVVPAQCFLFLFRSVVSLAISSLSLFNCSVWVYGPYSLLPTLVSHHSSRRFSTFSHFVASYLCLVPNYLSPTCFFHMNQRVQGKTQIRVVSALPIQPFILPIQPGSWNG